MKNLLPLIIFIATSCSERTNSQTALPEKQSPATPLKEFDTLDVYRLNIGSTYLFTRYDNFITSFGLPSKATVGKDTFEVRSAELMLNKFRSASPSTVTSLLYPGIVMQYFDEVVVADEIDFRNTPLTLTYNNISFNQNYTFSKFKVDFPTSATNSFKVDPSFYEVVTKEKSENVKHFYVTRRSKSAPDEILFVEFTFKNDKLIYLCFSNVS
jgi:hypothetical protein